MQLDYSLLLDNIKQRRFDEAIKDHVLTSAFHNEDLPKPIRYTLESMQEIDSAYAYKVYANSRKIGEKINKELEAKGINPMIRYQGPLRTETQIRLFGEVDMLFILDDKASHKDVFALGQLLNENCSKQDLQGCDYSDGVSVKLTTQKPVCKINLIPCSWMSNPQFEEKRNEIYRGIAVYNFKEKTRKKFLPFLNMARVDAKDIETSGNYKKLIRLWNSLCVDNSIALSSYELGCLAYSIENEKFATNEKQHLAFLPNVDAYLKELLTDEGKLETLLSPSKKELVFGKSPDKKIAVQKLLDAFEGLTNDLKEFIGEGLDAPIEYSTDVAGSSKPK